MIRQIYLICLIVNDSFYSPWSRVFLPQRSTWAFGSEVACIHVYSIPNSVLGVGLSVLIRMSCVFLLGPCQLILKPIPHLLDSLRDFIGSFNFGFPSVIISARGFYAGSRVISFICEEWCYPCGLIDKVIGHKLRIR